MADISKITTPDGTSWDVKDIKARGVELTQAEYDALEQTGEVLPDVDYHITDGNNPNVATASQVMYDNSHSGISATNVQAAIDKVGKTVYQQDYTDADSNNAFRCLFSYNALSGNRTEQVKKSDNFYFQPQSSLVGIMGNTSNGDGGGGVVAFKRSDPTDTSNARFTAQVLDDGSFIRMFAEGAQRREIGTSNGSTYETIIKADANNTITFGTKTTEGISSIVKSLLKDYIKVKYVDESNALLTKGKKLPIYLDSGYKFLCWQSVGSSINWVSGFPIYLSNCYANDGGGVFWNGSMPTTNGLMVRFWYYEVKDI
jgi:hypothetical protein